MFFARQQSRGDAENAASDAARLPVLQCKLICPLD
jgi:hypothetical protein